MAPERLITKHRTNQSRSAPAQPRVRRAGTAVMNQPIAPGKQPVIRCAFNDMDITRGCLSRKRRPSFREHRACPCCSENLNDDLCRSIGVCRRHPAETDVHRRRSLREKVCKFRWRFKPRLLRKKPVPGHAVVFAPIRRAGSHPRRQDAGVPQPRDVAAAICRATCRSPAPSNPTSPCPTADC